MKLFSITIIVSVCLLACGGIPKEQRGTYPILFEPDTVTLDGGNCITHLKVYGDEYQNVTLMTMITTLTDTNDSQNKVTFTDSNPENLFGSIFFPQAGLLEGDLTIDGNARGMSGGFSAAIVLTGNALNGYARSWAGILECIQ